MRHLLWVLGTVAGLAACTRPNPDFCATAADCKDPAKPFCDVDGVVSGIGNSCIATPPPDAGTAIDAPPGGCTPGQVLGCTASTLTTCNADGHTTMASTCAVGCAGDGTRCKVPVPSNGLATYIDMTTTPVDLALVGGTLDLDTSMFTPTSGSAMSVPSFKVAAPVGGAPITVFVGKKITLGQLTLSSAGSTNAAGLGDVGPAAAFLATDELDVQGRVLVLSGAVKVAGCSGVAGSLLHTGNATYLAGGGGGAHATDGADGGAVPSPLSGGAHGAASGTDELVPLRGGCPGGNTGQATGGSLLGGRGGGAIQLFSRAKVYVNATIDGDGLAVTLSDGFGGPSFGGGGGGGGALLEAPIVQLDVSAALLVRGGGGNSGDFQAVSSQDDGNAIPGGVSLVHDGTRANGGAGGTTTAGPVAGTSTASAVAGESTVRVAGGGGGGVGRIRINTADANITKAATSVLAGRVTTGIVSAR